MTKLDIVHELLALQDDMKYWIDVKYRAESELLETEHAVRRMENRFVAMGENE